MRKSYNHYYSLNRPFRVRWDLLEHYPCISLTERISTEATRFFQETIHEYVEKYGKAKIDDVLVDQYVVELGIRDQVIGVPKVSDITLWKSYTYIDELILSACKQKTLHPDRTRFCNLVNWILKSPSVDLSDIEKIYKTLNTAAKKEDVKQDKDFYKEIYGTIFQHVLPYKLHAYGITVCMNDFVRVDEEQDVESLGCNYLELLIRTFTSTLQGMRGRQLSEIKSDMRSLATVIYLFMSMVFVDDVWTKEDLEIFSMYIDLMMQFGIGDHIVSTAVELQNGKADWFQLTDGLTFDNPTIRKLIERTGVCKKIVNKESLSSRENVLNVEWNGVLLSGTGSFGKLAYDDGLLDDFCYELEQIDDATIRSVFDIPTTVTFQIPETDIGYLLDHAKADVCKVYYPGNESSMKTVIGLQGNAYYVLFKLPETKKVYGISTKSMKNGGRLLLQIGDEATDFIYRIADTGLRGV